MYVGARMAALEEKRLMTERGGQFQIPYFSLDTVFIKKIIVYKKEMPISSFWWDFSNAYALYPVKTGFNFFLIQIGNLFLVSIIQIDF